MPSSGSRARKLAANLSVRADLVRRARALNVNLSAVLESALETVVREAEREAWLAENADAIDDYNAQVAKRGAFGDAWRRF